MAAKASFAPVTVNSKMGVPDCEIVRELLLTSSAKNLWSLVENTKNLLPLAKVLASVLIVQGVNPPKLRDRL
jgi:hypothetical protein